MNVIVDQCRCPSKIFKVAKIAKLLHRPREHSVIRG